jgi:hypothetical protein
MNPSPDAPRSKTTQATMGVNTTSEVARPTKTSIDTRAPWMMDADIADETVRFTMGGDAVAWSARTIESTARITSTGTRGNTVQSVIDTGSEAPRKHVDTPGDTAQSTDTGTRRTTARAQSTVAVNAENGIDRRNAGIRGDTESEADRKSVGTRGDTARARATMTVGTGHAARNVDTRVQRTDAVGTGSAAARSATADADTTGETAQTTTTVGDAARNTRSADTGGEAAQGRTSIVAGSQSCGLVAVMCR